MKIQIIIMLLALLDFPLNARLLDISIEKRADEEIKKYSSYNFNFRKRILYQFSNKRNRKKYL